MTTGTQRLAIGLAALALMIGSGPRRLVAQDAPRPSAARRDTLHLGLDSALVRALRDNPGLKAAAEQAHALDHVADATSRQRYGDWRR